MKKKLLFVINTMGRAGAERVLISLLRTLNPDDFSIDLMAVIGRGELFAEVPAHVRVLNASPVAASVMDSEGKRFIRGLILRSLLKKAYGLRYIPYFIRNVYLQLRRGRLMMDKLFWKALSDTAPQVRDRYDLAIGFTEGAATYYVANRVDAAKKAAFVHVDYIVAGYIKKLDRPYYRKMDAIFSVSIPVRENFNAAYPEFVEKSAVFQNVVIPGDVIAKAEQPGGFTDDFDGLRILTVARLHPQKALDTAIPAFARLVQAGYDNLRWYVLGEGSERPLLEKLITQHGLEGRFILLGATPNPYPYFKQCDIYAHATHFEGWCIAVAEALILQRPTIVTDIAGSREQITDGETGLIITLSQENLANAVKRLADDPALRTRLTENLIKNKPDYTKDIRRLYDLTDFS